MRDAVKKAAASRPGAGCGLVSSTVIGFPASIVRQDGLAGSAIRRIAIVRKCTGTLDPVV